MDEYGEGDINNRILYGKREPILIGGGGRNTRVYACTFPTSNSLLNSCHSTLVFRY